MILIVYPAIKYTFDSSLNLLLFEKNKGEKNKRFGF